MQLETFMWLGVVGCFVSGLVVPLILRYLRPAARRQLHQTHGSPIGRLGGVALIVPFLVVAAVTFYWHPSANAGECWLIVTSAFSMFVLGFWDDLKPLGANKKLAGQILIASLVYFGGIHIGTFRNPLNDYDYVLGGWSYPATVLWLVAFTNLINLIDGVDGLAAGISLMVMGLLTYVGYHSGTVFAAGCAAGLCGALIGFLFFNFPPAKIYLGDGGAYFLGFVIGILSMLQSHKGTVAAALIAPMFALALPIVDVALAIGRRGLKGIPIFRPDQRHLHHRLAEHGFSRTRIVLMFYSCSLFFLMLALGIVVSKGRWLPILFGIGCVTLLASAGTFSFSRDWFAVGKVLGNSLEVRKQTKYAFALDRWFVLEAERSNSAEALWNDFGFVSRKLGFSSVTLFTPEGRRCWNKELGPLEEAPPQQHQRRFELPQTLALEFRALRSELSSTNFEFLSELAADTWLNGVHRWQDWNRMALKFRPMLLAKLRPELPSETRKSTVAPSPRRRRRSTRPPSACEPLSRSSAPPR